MPVIRVAAADALARLDAFDTVIDARSESEFALDCLPGAQNWPSLTDAQRAAIGTEYVQVGPFEARKHGAALVAMNIARHIDRHVQDKPKGWKPLVYCWRGGQRSGSLALVLGEIGFRVSVVEGGYKAFRGAVIADTPALAQRLDWRVVCGRTGCGKTRLLHALADAGAQVLDLEALASHRSSILGAVPGTPQPSQKRFESLVWDALRRFDRARPVFVESESAKIGNLAVPPPLVNALRDAACLKLELPEDERVALLMEDYAFFAREPGKLAERLDALVELRGKAVVEAWKQQLGAGQVDAVVRDLLQRHYDPGYDRSSARNFRKFGDAKVLMPADPSAGAMKALAEALLR